MNQGLLDNANYMWINYLARRMIVNSAGFIRQKKARQNLRTQIVKDSGLDKKNQSPQYIAIMRNIMTLKINSNNPYNTRSIYPKELF